MTVHISHHDSPGPNLTLASSWVQHSSTTSTGWAFGGGSVLWSCDLADGEWTLETSGGIPPMATRGAGAVMSPSSSTVYIFGGEYGTSTVTRVNTVHTLEFNAYLNAFITSASVWGLVATGGEAPEPRSGHSTTPLLDEAGSTSGLLVYAGLGATSVVKRPPSSCQRPRPGSAVLLRARLVVRRAQQQGPGR